MKKILFTLLAMSILLGVSAQNRKCAIDTKALVAEEIAAGATHINMLAKMTPGFNRGVLEKAGMAIGTQAGQIITLRIPVESLPLLESNKEVLQYSISHRVAAIDCDNTRADTRTDSVQAGLGIEIDSTFTGEGVYIGITDWGFDYTHINYNNIKKSNYRVEMAWDHFREAGPSPMALGYDGELDYGTVLNTRSQLLDARSDTSNIYSYGTHGTHVAGICAGRGYDNKYIGQAPKAKLLLCSFGLGEKEWMDAVGWMRQVAQDSARRLVINSSWGMYTFSTLDGSSLLSQAINAWADDGTVFCTSGGNNGRANVPFHISRTFRNDTIDTLRTVAVRASEIYSISDAGQALIMWGQKDHDFSAGVQIWQDSAHFWRSPMYSTADGDTVIYDTLRCDTLNVAYRVMIEHSNICDSLPHMQIDVAKVKKETQLFVTATEGTVHAWNVVLQQNHAGNAGCTFSARNHDGFAAGDNSYGVGEPACAAKCISVAAHSADRKRSNGTINEGSLADFSSHGPLINGRMKPEISAPGVGVISSISAWTDDPHTSVFSKTYLGVRYTWASMDGTSMSSPAATGVVALILQANPALTVDQIRDIIFTTARNDSKTGPLVERDSMDYGWGWGKIDALRAVNKALSLVSINQVESLRTPLKVYPNPATSSVTVKTLCGEPQTLRVYTVDGRLVQQQTVTLETTFDISRWTPGIYILRVGSRTEKLVVK